MERGGDQKNATVRFEPLPGALGYNVRWGVAPDRLFLTYQIYADDLRERGGALEVRALNTGVDYWFAVDAVGGAGIARGAGVVAAPARGRPAS